MMQAFYSGTCLQVSSLLIFDANTLEILHSHELGDGELAISLESCHLGQNNQPYLVVGTAIIHAEEAEAKSVIESCIIWRASIEFFDAVMVTVYSLNGMRDFARVQQSVQKIHDVVTGRFVFHTFNAFDWNLKLVIIDCCVSDDIKPFFK